MKKPHKFQSVLISLCLLVSTLSFSSEKFELSNSDNIHRAFNHIISNSIRFTLKSEIAKVSAVPNITAQPQSQSVCAGDNVTFSVTVTGTGSGNLVFLWKKNGVTITNAVGRISGATTASLTLSNISISDADNYTCVITDDIDSTNTITSDPATLIVKSPPVLSSPLTATVCSGIANTYIGQSSDNSSVLKWVRRAATGISPAPLSTLSANGNINEVLTNTTSAPIDVYYDYTLTLNGCTNTQSVKVTVNPKSQLTSSLTPAAVCSGSTFSYTPSTNVTGTTFSWTRGAQTGISELSSSGTGSISEVLRNTTDASIGVIYNYTLTTLSNCVSTGTITVDVKPVPSSAVSINGASTVCRGSEIDYSTTAITNATGYRWTLPDGSITDTNSTTLSINYAIMTSSGNLSVAGLNECGVGVSSPAVAITVLAPPVLSSPLTATVCSGIANTYIGQSSDNSSVLKWVRRAATGISPAPLSTLSANGNINEVLTNTTSAPIDVYYDYTLTLNGCTNTQSVKVTVNPKSQLTSSLTPAAVCSGSTFSYTPSTNVTGTTFSWTRGAQTGISELSSSGTGSISEVLRNTTDASIGVIYNYTLTTLSNCVSTGTITVDVKPVPSSAVSINGASTVCRGSEIDYSTTAITNATGYRWTLPDGSITDTNSTTLSINYAIMTSSGNLSVAGLNECGVGVSSPAVAITVLAPPVLSSPLTATVCSGIANTYIGQSSDNSSVLKWVRRAATGISPAPLSTLSANGNINEVLTNTTSAPIDVYYDYTLTLNGCTNTQSVKVTVNPKSQLTSSLTPAAVCSGSTFSYTPSTNVTGTTFSWTRGAQTGISELSSSGTGSISEVLRNTTDASIGVIYNYTLTTLSNCVSTGTITVDVKPVPSSAVSINGASTVCRGSEIDYSTTAITNATGYRWTLPDGSITDTNSTTLSINYAIMTSSGNLSVAGLNECGVGVSSPAVAITVLAPPVLSSPLTATVCSGIANTYIGQSSDNSSVLKWVRRAATGISPAPLSTLSVNGNINETLTNTTSAPIDVYYDYSLSLNGCINTQSIKVTVNPISKLSSTLTPPTVCSGVSFEYTPNFTVSGTTFSWSRSAQAGISELSSSGTGSISEVLTNTTNASVGVDYIFSLTSPSGCTFTETVRVNVTPLPSAPITITGDKTVCIGIQRTYNITAIPNATSYRWTLPNGSTTDTNITSLIVDYSVVTSSGNLSVAGVNSCGVGVAKTEVITVLAPPALSSSLTATVCSGSPFAYTATSSNSSSTMSWSRAVVPGISNVSATSITGNISETLVNTTSLPIEVVYVYTLTLNGCTNTQIVTVTVNPNDLLLNIPSAVELCSGATFNFTPTTSIDGSIFSWNRGTVVRITPTINERLDNNGTTPINVVYNYKLTTAEGCISPNRSFTVKVNPSPKLINIPTTSFCTTSNQSVTFTYNPTANIPGVNISWTRAAKDEIQESSSSGINSEISETLTSTSTTKTVFADYSFVLDDTVNGCDATDSFSVRLEKIPDGIPVIEGDQMVCAGSSNNRYKASFSTNTSRYVWTLPNGNEITTSSDTINLNFPTTTTSYFLKVEGINTCGRSTISDSYPITVIPPPTLSSPKTASICSGSLFAYTPNSSDGNARYTWSRPAIDGISNPQSTDITGNIEEVLVNTTNLPIDVLYRFTIFTTGGCKNIQDLIVTVKPTPNLIEPTLDQVACSGNVYSYIPSFSLPVTTFNWTRVAVVGITPFTPPVVASVSSLTETLTNTTSSPIEVVYQLTATSGGCSKTSELRVLVQPSPSAAGTITGPTIICSGSLNQEFRVPVIPNATTYDWTLPTGAVITDGLNTNVIKVNFGSGVASGNVVVKGLNSCGEGISTTLPITIVPLPTLSSPQTANICSGSEFTYTPISSDSSTAFRWSRATMIGISNPSATGTGVIVETLINTTGLPINVVYEYELENEQGCISTQQVTVKVKPTPNLIEPTLDQVACSGNVYSYTPSFSLPVTTFNWTRVAVVGITPFTPPVVASVSSLTETLTNTTSSPIEVVYQLTATSGGCSKTSELRVLVQPSPSAAGTITGPTIICSGSLNQEFRVPVIPNATTYDWTLPTGAVITDGLNTNVIKVNFGSGVASGNVVVKGLNSCGEGISTTLPITIVPLPTLSSPQTANICSGSEFTYTPISSDSSTAFRWSRATMIGISNPSATGTGVIVETLINTTGLPINVVYEYELENEQGCISTQQVTVTVKPTPNLIEPTLDQVACSGNVYSYIPSFSLPVTTFNWTRVAVVGITPFTPPVVASVSSLTETLTNTTSSPIEVVYQLTATSGGCSKTSELRVLVQPSPSAAGTITGPTIICSGSLNQEFRVPVIPNATTYDWTLPTGAVITDGLNTNVIKVNFGSGVASGNVVVKGLNSCGEGIAFSLPVTIYQNAMVSLVSGNPNTTLCMGSSFVTPIKYAISPSTEELKLTGKLPAGVDFTSSTGIITGTPTESGSFPFTITSTSNCSNSLSGIIVVNPLQSIAKLSGTVNQIACINTEIDPIVYSIAKGTTGVLINPVLPLGIVATVDEVNGLVSISGTPTVATSLAQNYVITTQGSCGSPASTTISFDIKPAVILDFISPTATLNQAVCLNGPIIPIRFSVGGGATGIITPVLPAGLTISQDPLTLVYTIQGNPTANGTFTIPITTTGCTKTEIITISNVNTAVSIDLLSASGTDQQTLCQTNFNSPIVPIQYTIVGATSVQVLGLPSGVNFVYDSAISKLVISGTPIQTGIFNYTITSLPCSIIKTGVLKVSIPMFISSESVKNVSCSKVNDGEIAVTIIGGVPLSGSYSVQWTGPNNFQQNRLNITGLQAGEYTLTGRDAIGCLIPSKKYTILPASPINISLVSTTNISCNGSLGCANLNYTGGTGIYTNFVLQFLDPSLQMWTSVPNPSNNYFNVCNLKAGLYRIAVTDSNSCTTEPFQFTIYDYGSLKIDSVNLDNKLCSTSGGKVRVSLSTLDPNLTFFYNNVVVPFTKIGNKLYELSISNPTSPTGNIKVTNNENCWDTITLNTTVINPSLSFTSLNLTTYGNVSVNESIKFTNGLTATTIPPEYDYLVWDFGDNSPLKVFYNPEDINPNSDGESLTTVFHSYAKDGLYTVTLIAYNQFGCSKSITEVITVGQGASIMAPTAFSPNNDGINDLFRPSLLGLKEVNVNIYDHWGNLIYEITSDTASLPTDWGWNGLENGKSEPVNGTYRYYIMAKTINDLIIEKEGQFILIK